MDSLAVAALVSQDAMSRTALSALPDAPVLPERQRPSRSPRLRRPRRGKWKPITGRRASRAKSPRCGR